MPLSSITDMKAFIAKLDWGSIAIRQPNKLPSVQLKAGTDAAGGVTATATATRRGYRRRQEPRVQLWQFQSECGKHQVVRRVNMVRQVDLTIATANRGGESGLKSTKKRAPEVTLVKEEPTPIRRRLWGKTGKRELGEELPSAKRREVPEARVIDDEMEDESEAEGSAW
eukprot:15820842-Heterocapsa_arctica.AAC.1